MQDFERIDLTMKEVGEHCDVIEEIIRIGEDRWELLIQPDVEFLAEFDRQQQSLVITAEVAIPAAKDLLPVYEALLQFNQMRAETGGVTMSLSTEGIVEQSFRLNVAVLEPHVLQHVLENLAEKVLMWRSVLHVETSDQEPDQPPSFDARMMV